MQQNCSQHDVPEALRDPPGDPLGASGGHLGRPKTTPRGAKSDPRRPQEPPRAPQEPSRELREAPSETPWAPEASREQFWAHFGASGGRFSSLRRSILVPPGGDFRDSGGRLSMVLKHPKTQDFRTNFAGFLRYFRNTFKLRGATEALPAPRARRARAAGEQGHKRFTRSYTLAVLTLWSLLRWCSWSRSRPRRSCTLAVLTLGLLLPLLR